MRNDLELIKKIEELLTGQLSASEKAEFEKEIANDPELQEEVRLQQQLMQGIERAAIKQSVQQAGTRFKRMRRFYNGGLGGLILVVVIASVFYFTHQKKAYRDGNLPVYNEQGGKDWASADSNLVAQTFMIDAGKDTVIETKGGIVLSIPANGFLENNGGAVNGEIEFVVKEALDRASIIKAGLSSRAGNNLLETGGMFFIDARKNGDPIKINPKNSIYGEVPTDTIKGGMQLFQGKRLANGTIDWVNPKALNHDLVPVDINSLNFYPPNYLDSLAKWGYDSHNKKFTDSLYYSLAWGTEPGPALPAAPAPVDKIRTAGADTVLNSRASPMSGDTEKTSSSHDHLCAINPAKIRAIWNEKFQNTILATREFEQRLYWIHKSGQNGALDMYVNNLDKPLGLMDAAVAYSYPSLRARFYEFALRHDGGINTNSKQLKKLQQYYRIKTKLFAEASEKTRNDIWKKREALDRIADKKQDKHQEDVNDQNAKNFNEEFELNLKDAYRQLGYEPGNLQPIAKATYNAQISTTGWCNVDRYVYESVVNRTTMNFTDKETGKTAKIQYLPVAFYVPDFKAYDRLYVYLMADSLSSYMRINGADGKYTEKLDELMRYNLVCIGYKGEQAFLYALNNIQPKEYRNIELTSVAEKDLQELLNKTGSKSQLQTLQNEIAYQRFDIKNEQRYQRENQADNLTNRTKAVISVCNVPYGRMSVSITKGEAIFKSNCIACHRIDMMLIGPALGPVITEETDDKWLTRWIQNNQALINTKDPKAVKVYKQYNSKMMTVFADLSNDDVASIIAYVRNDWKKRQFERKK